MRILTQSDYPGRWWMMLPEHARWVPALSTILEAVLHHYEIASLLRVRRLGDLRSKDLLRKSVDSFRRSTTSGAPPGTFLTAD